MNRMYRNIHQRDYNDSYAMSEETESTPKQEAPKNLVERLRSRCVL